MYMCLPTNKKLLAGVYAFYGIPYIKPSWIMAHVNVNVNFSMKFTSHDEHNAHEKHEKNLIANCEIDIL